MPTYEYHCDGCEHEFEEFQSFAEKPVKKCPECRKSKLRRLFGTGAAVRAGAGQGRYFRYILTRRQGREGKQGNR